MVLTEANRELNAPRGKPVLHDKENCAAPAPSPVQTLELVFSRTVAEPCTPPDARVVTRSTTRTGRELREMDEEEEVEPCTPTAARQRSTARTGRELREEVEVGRGVELKGAAGGIFGEVTQSMSFAQGTFISVFVPKPKTEDSTGFQTAKNPFEPKETTLAREELTQRLAKANQEVAKHKAKLSRQFGDQLADYIVSRPDVQDELLADLDAHEEAGRAIEQEIGAKLEAHAAKQLALEAELAAHKRAGKVLEEELAGQIEEHEQTRVKMLAMTANLDVLDTPETRVDGLFQ